jgi:hypothetical protein
MSLEDIEKIATSEIVKVGIGFKELINKELILGQSRYVCRYGTLSDGHDKITEAQRYYQAIREMFVISNEMNMNLARAMDAQAELIEAGDLIESPKKADAWRAKAKKLRAETQLEGIYLTLQDQARMLDEYNKVRLELQVQVRKEFPEGIEQAEPANWQAVGEYWAFKKQAGALGHPLTHLPMPADKKAILGLTNRAPELAGWFLAKNAKEIKEQYKGNSAQFLADRIGIDPRKIEAPKENPK